MEVVLLKPQSLKVVLKGLLACPIQSCWKFIFTIRIQGKIKIRLGSGRKIFLLEVKEIQSSGAESERLGPELANVQGPGAADQRPGSHPGSQSVRHRHAPGGTCVMFKLVTR